ncbi:hypothetical protein PCASD_25562 [Puccinia coronata f. sp. avenae]|uniref:CCHC-type domain-containing protein n=1 Tax=Puccinia coronata f. sp. avenae TaxID=200324 RepID=A0A2N5S2B1_9BASI|nr:hypothetical protein PCASD_25562 [Puccinia coronata f. sp. avenae]
MKAQRDKDRLRREHNDYRARRKADLDKQKRVTSIVTAVAKRFQPEDILRSDCTNLRQWERTVRRGLIAARPKGVRTPPQTPKKRRAGAARLPTQACKPPHALPRMPHAVRTPTNGVRTAGLACGPAGQACWPCTPVWRACRPCTPSGQACTAGTPVRPGSHKPLELRGLREPLGAYKGTKRYPYKGTKRVPKRYPYKGTKRYPYKGTKRYPYKGTKRYPYKGTKRYPYKGTKRYPYKGTKRYPYKGTKRYPYKGTKRYPYKGTKRYPYKGTKRYPYKGTKRYPYKGTKRYPYKGTKRYPYKGTKRYPYKGTKRYPYKGTKRYPYKGTKRYPYKGTKRYPYKGTKRYPYKGTKRYPYKGTKRYPYKGIIRYQTGTKRYPYKGTKRYPYKGTKRYPYKGTKRYPYKGTKRYPYKGTKRYPYKGTKRYPYKGTKRYPYKGTKRYPYKGTKRYPYKGTKRYPYKGTKRYPYKGTKRYPYKGTKRYPYKGTKRYPYKGTKRYPYKGTKRYPYKGTKRYPYKGTKRYPYKGTEWYPYKGNTLSPYKGTKRYPYKGTVWYPCKGTVWCPYKGTVWYPYKGTVWYPYKGTKWYPYKGVPAVHACPEGVQGLHALQTGVHGQHACLAGPHAEPAVLTPFVGVRHAGVCTPGWEGVQPPHAFFLGVQGGVRTPFGRAAIKPPALSNRSTCRRVGQARLISSWDRLHRTSRDRSEKSVRPVGSCFGRTVDASVHSDLTYDLLDLLSAADVYDHLVSKFRVINRAAQLQLWNELINVDPSEHLTAAALYEKFANIGKSFTEQGLALSWEEVIGLVMQNKLKDSIRQAVDHKVKLFMESHQYELPSSQDMLQFIDAARTEQRLTEAYPSTESHTFQMNLANRLEPSAAKMDEGQSIKACAVGKNPRCYICNKPNHLAPDYPNKRRGQPTRQSGPPAPTPRGHPAFPPCSITYNFDRALYVRPLQPDQPHQTTSSKITPPNRKETGGSNSKAIEAQMINPDLFADDDEESYTFEQEPLSVEPPFK